MKRTKLFAMIAITTLVMGTACTLQGGGAADVDTVTDDEPTTNDQPEPPSEEPTTSGDTPASEPEAPPTDQPDDAGEGALLLIMDASGSMTKADTNGNTLMDGAKQALRDVVEGLPDGMHTGLRVYGHRVPNTDEQRGCKDTELIHPVAPLDHQAMLDAVDGFQAKGYTPIGLSLQKAADDLPPEGARSIILVSDGEDTCAPPNPCKVAATLREDGVDLVIETVGFALGDNNKARKQLECIAEKGGGQFHDVSNAAELTEALQQVSDRQARKFEASGTALEGAPIPRDAATGQADTAYTDTILGTETNYYRFEIPPGSQVQGEAIISPNPDVTDVSNCTYVSLTDEATDDYAYTTISGNPQDQALVAHTDPVVVDADEVWLEIEPISCYDDDAPFDVELQVTVVR